MKLFVVGANGKTGVQVVRQALHAGHEVTAFVRRPGGLQEGVDRLASVRGDVAA